MMFHKLIRTNKPEESVERLKGNPGHFRVPILEAGEALGQEPRPVAEEELLLTDTQQTRGHGEESLKQTYSLGVCYRSRIR